MTSPATLKAIEGHAKHLGRDFDAWIGLFAEDAVLEFPHFASLGWPTEARGRETIRANLESFLQSVDDFFQNVRILEAADPDVVFAEYEVHAAVRATGRRYDQSYIAMLTTRDGKIARLRWVPRHDRRREGLPAERPRRCPLVTACGNAANSTKDGETEWPIGS
jgi:ketosteroid isomerase-like protein